MKLRFADSDLEPAIVGLTILSAAGRPFSPKAKAFVERKTAVLADILIPLVRPDGYPGVAQAQVLDVPGDEGVFLYVCDATGKPVRPAEYFMDPGPASYVASGAMVR